MDARFPVGRSKLDMLGPYAGEARDFLDALATHRLCAAKTIVSTTSKITRRRCAASLRSRRLPKWPWHQISSRSLRPSSTNGSTSTVNCPRFLDSLAQDGPTTTCHATATRCSERMATACSTSSTRQAQRHIKTSSHPLGGGTGGSAPTLASEVDRRRSRACYRTSNALNRTQQVSDPRAQINSPLRSSGSSDRVESDIAEDQRRRSQLARIWIGLAFAARTPTWKRT